MNNVVHKINQILTAHKKDKVLGIIILLVIIAAVPLTVFIAQTQQDLRQRAASGNLLGAPLVDDKTLEHVGTYEHQCLNVEPNNQYTLSGTVTELENPKVGGIPGSAVIITDAYTGECNDAGWPTGTHTRTITPGNFTISATEKSVTVIRRVINAKASFSNLSLVISSTLSSSTNLLNDALKQDKTMEDVGNYERQCRNVLNGESYTLSGTVTTITNPMVGGTTGSVGLFADAYDGSCSSGWPTGNFIRSIPTGTFTIDSDARSIAVIRRVINAKASFAGLSLIMNDAPTFTPTSTPGTDTGTPTPTTDPSILPAPEGISHLCSIVNDKVYVKLDWTPVNTAGQYQVSWNEHTYTTINSEYTLYNLPDLLGDRDWEWSVRAVASNGTLGNIKGGSFNCPSSDDSPTSTPTITKTPTPTGPTSTPSPTPESATPTPTTTPAPGDVVLKFDVKLQGVGNENGENPGPLNLVATNNLPGPINKTRTLTVQVFDKNEQLVTGDKRTGNVIYDEGTTSAPSDTFKGTVNLGQLQPGPYTFKIKSDKYLRKRTPGSFTVIANATAPIYFDIPKIKLITGDIVNMGTSANIIDALDYNAYFSCVRKPVQNTTAMTCADTDLNDDGLNDSWASLQTKTREWDYRLLFDAFKIHEGD